MYKRILLALALLVLLSGVTVAAAQTATWTPTPIGMWCYRFPFSSGQHGFTTPENLGVYEGGFNGGFRQSVPEVGSWGQLTLNYTHTVTVFPSEVEIKLRRGGFTLGPIDAQIAGNLFGLEIQPEPTLFTLGAEEDVASIVVSPLNADNFSNQFTLYLDALQYLYVTDVYVRGFGVNPFGSSNCIELDHPPAVTGTPTVTVTAPTPTQGACLLPGQPTPTPTNTPEGNYDWVEVFDFTQNDGGWSVQSGIVGNYVSGSGWETDYQYFPDSNLAYRVVVIERLFSSRTVNYVKVEYTRSVSYGVNNGESNFALGANSWANSLVNYTNDNYAPIPVIWTGAVASPDLRLQLMVGRRTGADPGGVGVITRVTVAGSGTNPFPTPTPYSACTSTPTITPSVSPTPTNTPTPFTLTPTFTRTPTRTPFPIIIPTAVPTATAGPSSTPNPSQTPQPTRTPMAGETLPAPTGTAGPFGPFEVGGAGDGGGLGGLGNGVLAFGSNLWNRATGWATNMADGIGRLTDAWATSVPTPLPYMPQCRSDALANELCAIWYILTFTVFSGDLGGLIIPMAVLIVDVYFLFMAIRLARAILARARRVQRS